MYGTTYSQSQSHQQAKEHFQFTITCMSLDCGRYQTQTWGKHETLYKAGKKLNHQSGGAKGYLVHLDEMQGASRLGELLLQATEFKNISVLFISDGE